MKSMKLYEPELVIPTSILYMCPICGSKYHHEKAALDCLQQKYDTKGFKIGEFVIVPAKWSCWYYGDPSWIACTVQPDPSSDDHFERVVNTHGWYVVTNITIDRYSHDIQLHLATKYLVKGNSGDNISGGFTTLSGSHHTPYRPYEISDRARELWRLPTIGQPPESIMADAEAMVENRLTFPLL